MSTAMFADAASAATVVVRRSTGGKNDAVSITAGKTNQEMENIDKLLGSCIELLIRAPSSLAPWKGKSDARKRVAAAKALNVQRMQLQTLLPELVNQAASRSNEAEMAISRLMEADQAVREAQAAKDAAEASLQSIGGIATRKINLRDEENSTLQEQVKALEAEKIELQATIAKMVRSKEISAAKLKETSKKLTEVTAEYQSTADVAEREIRRLQMELKKSEEAREAALRHTNHESASALVDKTRELRTLQRRYDSMKGMAETSKDAAATARKQVEKMAAQQAKAAEAAEAQVRRLAELKGARDASTAELEALRSEHVMLHGAFVAAGGVEVQASALLRLAAKRAPESGTRSALRARHGLCLHARPCGTAQDVYNIVPVPYRDAAGLEAVVREQKLVVCTTCLAEGLF